MTPIRQRHAWTNRLQTLLLIFALLGISALAGSLLFGSDGVWVALGAAVGALLIEPSAASRLTLSLYRARPIHPAEAPALWELLKALAARAGLPATPIPHYVPSPVVNAFAVGSPRNAAIAVTDGLLRAMSRRELAGVLAHEVAHIAHGDLRVMGLADYVSRLTHFFSLLGVLVIVISFPWLLAAGVAVNWPALLLLVVAPQLALLAQLGLSRVREFDADLAAAGLTGDPEGLASALVRIERGSRSWRSLILPGWGNPEPSWLRTHPATEQRVRRLLDLAAENAEAGMVWAGEWAAPRSFAPITRRPRWHADGLWR